ncbi:MAG TPA: S8 family serine peptidase [Acidimicrobiales bacterium]|jgi:subtilisin|nr:S8 family serine peptidase [Acidimicrobiales bacterium]
MSEASTTQHYVVLPAQGLRARAPGTTPTLEHFLRSTRPGLQDLAAPGGRSLHLRVVDVIGDDGARLIEATPADASALRTLQPSVRVVPLAYYVPAVAPRRHVAAVAPAAAAAGALTLRVVSDTDGAPVAGAIVVAFTSVAAGLGAQGTTDERGEVVLNFRGSDVVLERLYVYPLDTYWSLRREAVALADGSEVRLRRLALDYVDGLRHQYRNVADDHGEGVTVGVVDTGVAEHPDLVIAGGANTVAGEDPGDYGDNGLGHGTHVAGIVAARGRPPEGIRGVAPGVSLRAYRVFGQGSGQASSFAIAKAIDQAVLDGCDLVNLSLGGGPPDPVLRAAIEDARAAGTVCVMAAGNNSRGPVSFPASDELAVAVSALGRKGTFPDDSAEVDTVVAPYGSDEAEFIGDFSNVGPQMDLTAPGVGIISTVPGGYSEISGTSMACPAATGVAARLVAAAPDLLGATRDAARSEAIVAALYASARDRGFPDPFEGHGLPQPC